MQSVVAHRTQTEIGQTMEGAVSNFTSLQCWKPDVGFWQTSASAHRHGINRIGLITTVITSLETCAGRRSDSHRTTDAAVLSANGTTMLTSGRMNFSL